MNFFDFFKKNLELCKQLIIGVDFTGVEAELNKSVMENEKIITEMKNLNLQFYNHAGEYIVDRKINLETYD